MAAVFFGALAPGAVSAHFERVVTSARIEALGGTFVSVADDPAAVTVNPAGLALSDTLALLLTYHKPYNLDDLNSGYAAAALPTRAGVWGLSWHYTGLRGVMSESVFTVGWARHIISNSQDASLSIGANIEYRMAGADATGSRDGYVTGGAGVLLRPFAMIGVGYSINNVVAGEIDLLGGGPVTEQKYQQAWGLSYRWNNRVRISVERHQDTRREWRNRAGLEIITHPNLHMRAGVNRNSLTGGFGVLWRELRVDVGVVSHESLGPTWVFSVGFLPKVKRPYVVAQ
jgi:hypothetical protein